ncbi:MAG: hypothetical protein ACK6EB_37425, partial [Planctomyces sp.]
MTEETTSEQLAEIEGQATEFTPPDGWRVVQEGEELRQGDVRVNDSGAYSAVLVTVTGVVPPGTRYIRPIEPQPQPADTVDELRSEVSYVQNLLGESRQRVTHLEELVTSLQREVAVAKEELTIAAAVSHQLQIELDAAQQVPVDSLDLQQLRLRLADMTLDRDTCKDAYDRIFADLCTIKETTKAETVEAIVEWLEPVRLVDSPNLANETMQHLPQIM